MQVTGDVPAPILAACPAEFHPQLSEWWQACIDGGLNPAREFGSYRFWMNWRQLTPNWWDDLEKMRAANWTGLLADTRGQARQAREYREMVAKMEAKKLHPAVTS